MELYLNTSFFRSFTYYFDSVDIEKRPNPEQRQAFFIKSNSLREGFADDKRIEWILEWISYISEQDKALINEPRYDAYMKLKTELPDLSDSDLLNLYAVMFRIEDGDTTPFPTRDILLDHYPEIVLRIAKEGKTPLVFSDEHDVSQFEKAVYTVLCDYIFAYCESDKLEIWGEYYEDAIEKKAELVDGFAGEECVNVDCKVYITDIETVNRMKRSEYAAGYYSTDIDRSTWFIGNLLTYTTGLFSNAVTLQITGHKYFDSYEEMYSTLGTDAFGYKNKTPAECAKETEYFFSKCYPEGPLALKVRKLPFPLLTKKDFIKLKELYKSNTD